jgi:hypothetical protein
VRLEGTAQVEVDAAPERCFAVLTEFERYPEWYGCDDARIVDSGPPVVELVYELPLLEIALTLRFSSVAPTSLEGELIAASSRVKDLKTVRWLLEPLPDDRTRASYSLDVDIAVPLPLRAVAARRGRELLLEHPVAELKRRSETRPGD